MKLLDRLNQELQNFFYVLVAQCMPIRERVENDVPYVSQFATPESAELSLRKHLDPARDPAWSKTGAKSPERYSDWAFTMCGMACASMVLKYFNQGDFRIANLAEDALLHGVYAEVRKIFQV